MKEDYFGLFCRFFLHPTPEMFYYDYVGYTEGSWVGGHIFRCRLHQPQDGTLMRPGWGFGVENSGRPEITLAAQVDQGDFS